MSVYRPKTKTKDGKEKLARFWHYDFVIAGRRFHGSTGQTNKRNAETFEETERRKVAAGEYDKPAADTVDLTRMTLNQAAGAWWVDVAQHKRSAKTIRIRINTVLRLIGANTAIGDIRTATVHAAVQKRRAQTTDHDTPLSPATVNRDIVETLRPILRHVDEIHEIGLPSIAWRKLRLHEEPAPEREFEPAQIAAWGDALDIVPRFFLGLALTYGPRFGELFAPLDAIKADRCVLEIGRYKGREGWRPSRKDGSTLKLPIAPDHARIISVLAGRAAAAGLDTFWFDEDAKGRLTEITYWAMYNRLRHAAAKVGIPAGRIIHGMRHHAGTTILRATGNLIVAQRTLGHTDVRTTQRYAHASETDVRDGLAAASRTSPETLALASSKLEEKQGDSE